MAAKKTKGTIDNPVFITSGGTELQLRLLPQLIIQHLMLDWTKKCPMPKPHDREASIAGRAAAVPDDENKYFQEEKALWDSSYAHTRMVFVLYYGVANKVPANWDGSEFFDSSNTPRFKAAWIESLLIKDEDIEGLTEAITGLNDVTPDGIEEAEKNSE